MLRDATASASHTGQLIKIHGHPSGRYQHNPMAMESKHNSPASARSMWGAWGVNSSSQVSAASTVSRNASTAGQGKRQCASTPDSSRRQHCSRAGKDARHVLGSAALAKHTLEMTRTAAMAPCHGVPALQIQNTAVLHAWLPCSPSLHEQRLLFSLPSGISSERTRVAKGAGGVPSDGSHLARKRVLLPLPPPLPRGKVARLPAGAKYGSRASMGRG